MTPGRLGGLLVIDLDQLDRWLLANAVAGAPATEAAHRAMHAAHEARWSGHEASAASRRKAERRKAVQAAARAVNTAEGHHPTRGGMST